MEPSTIPGPDDFTTIERYRLWQVEQAVEKKADKTEVQQVVEAVESLRKTITLWCICLVGGGLTFAGGALSLLHH